VAPHTQGAQVWITQFYLQITPYLPLPRKRSPDGATTDCSGKHLVTAYYSFIDLEGMKGSGMYLSVKRRVLPAVFKRSMGAKT